MTTEHRTDLIEAYALNALDPDEQAAVEEHIAVCASCKQLARSSQDVVNMLALAVPPTQPPLRCKRRVMERIEREQFLTRPTPRRSQRRPWTSSWVTAAAVALALVMSGWSFNLQRQLMAAQNEIGQMRAQMVQQETQVTQMQQTLTQYISASRVLADAEPICTMKNPEIQAVARCYARPGYNNAVMTVDGLPDPEPGKVYQLWLAHGNTQEPLNVFVPHNGTYSLEFSAPETFDRYTEIMVTVEDEGGATDPSDEVVLAGTF